MSVVSGRTTGSARRAVLVSALVTALVQTGAPPATASHFAGVTELQGTDTVAAAAAFSQHTFPDGATEAVLGRADTFPDSLASGSLQATRPLLLTAGNALDPRTSTELQRLKAKTVHILGGVNAISTAVEQSLTQGGYTVRRHRGATRIETAIAVAKVAVPAPGSVIVARAFSAGDDPTQAFADSLAAGAWSAASARPVVLTDSATLSPATRDYLQQAKPTRAYLVGGQAAVSAAVEAQIAALGIAVERVSGPTRFDTAVEIAARRGMPSGAEARKIVVVEGQAATAWAPGFAAAAYGARNNAVVLLANGDALPAPTQTFLGGGDPAVELLCAPMLATVACDAAAAALDKSGAASITLDAATVAQYSEITGKATPADGITTLTADGCGLTEESVLVAQDGTFAVRVPNAPGTCTLSMRATTASGPVSRSFPLTVTAATAATPLPELMNAELAQPGTDTVTVRFIFSEIVSATAYQGTTPSISADKFVLYEPRTSTTANPGLRAKGKIGTAKRDPNNTSAVLVDFPKAAYDVATVAAADRHAAEDLDGGWSVPGWRALKAVDLAAARTDLPDLTTVGGVTTTGAPAGKFRATYTFDEAFADADLPDEERYIVVLTDGRVIDAESVTVSGLSHVAQFDPTDTREPEGGRCSTDCPTVQTAVSGVRRGALDGDARRPLQVVAVAAEGVTDRPDLASVTINETAGTADFTFDQDVSANNLEAAAFTLFAVDGSVTPASSVTRSSARVVRATFGGISPLMVGAVVASEAVDSDAGVNAPDMRGIAQHFDAGEVFGPKLVEGAAGLIESSQDGKSYTWQITWVFDQTVQTPDFGGLLLYTSDGKRYGQEGGDSTGNVAGPPLRECEQLDGRTMQCVITFTDIPAQTSPTAYPAIPASEKTPALVAALWKTAESTQVYLGARYQSIESNARL